MRTEAIRSEALSPAQAAGVAAVIAGAAWTSRARAAARPARAAEVPRG